MFPEERILARGYSTPEEALAPLRSALPWMERVEGDFAIPISEFVFQYGEGKGRIRYRVRIAAEDTVEGISVVLRAERLNASEVIGLLLGAAAFSALVGFSRLDALPFAISVAVLIGAVRIGYVWRHVGAVAEAFSLPYSGAESHSDAILRAVTPRDCVRITQSSLRRS